MNANEPKPSAPDEVASAEAELLAAQEALDTARARLAELKEQHPPLSAASPERVCDGTEQVEVKAVVVDGDTSEVEAVVFQTVPPCTPAGQEHNEEKDGEEGRLGQSAAAGDGSSAAVTIPIESAEESEAPEKPPVQFPGQGSPSTHDQQAPEKASAEPVGAWVPYSTQASTVQGQGAQPPFNASGTVPPPPPGAVYYDQPHQPHQPSQPNQPYAGYVAPGYQQNPAPHAGPGAVPPQQPYPGYPYQNNYQQPYYQQPYYQQPAVHSKDHVAAAVLAFFLGPLGIHKFYLGYNTAGFIMLAVTIIGGIITFSVSAWAMWIVSIIEGIIYLTKSQAEFEQMYVVTKRDWF